MLAQTTIITQEPVQGSMVVTTAALQLTPAQAAVEYRVGTRIPSNAPRYTMPRDLAVEVPAVRWYKYMTVNGRVLLVDLATNVGVAGVAE